MMTRIQSAVPAIALAAALGSAPAMSVAPAHAGQKGAKQEKCFGVALTRN